MGRGRFVERRHVRFGEAACRGIAQVQPDIRVETERLILRPFAADHFDDYFRLLADPRTFRFSERGAMTSDEAWTRLLRHVGHWTLAGHGLFAVHDRESDDFLGEAGLGDFRRQIGADFDPFPEAAWTISPERQGRGFATEAMSAALAWMEGAFGPSPSVCLIHAENAPSLQVARKLGYRPFAERIYRGYRALLHSRE